MKLAIFRVNFNRGRRGWLFVLPLHFAPYLIQYLNLKLLIGLVLVRDI